MAAYYSDILVEEVWKRVEEMKPNVRPRARSRRPTVALMTLEVDLLLEYKRRHELDKKELTRCKKELKELKEETKLIKEILQTTNAGSTAESSLEDLVKLSLPRGTSDMVKKIYHIALVEKFLTLAVKDGLDKVKNGSKTPIPQDSCSTPTFYNIIKAVEKHYSDVKRDLECATRLWLCVKDQSQTLSAMQQYRAKIRRNDKPAAGGSIVPTNIKPAHHSSSGSVVQGRKYQCHLLLKRHPASTKISSPEYMKLTTLDHKLKYILDELEGYQMGWPRCFIDDKKSSQKQSKMSQTETEDAGVNVNSSTEEKERSCQASPEPLDNARESNNPQPMASVRMIESCLSCKKRYVKYPDGKYQQLSTASPLPAKDPVEDLNGNINTEPQPTNVVQQAPQTQSGKLQTEIENDDLKSSAERKERSYQTSPEPLMDVPSSTDTSKVMVADRQLHITNQLPGKDPVEDHNVNIIPEEATDSVPADDIKEQSASEAAHQDVLTEKNPSNDETPVPQPTNVVQKAPQTQSVGPETVMENDDLKSSAERKERSYQTLPEPPMDVPSSTDTSKDMVANPLSAKDPVEDPKDNIISDIKEQPSSEAAHQDVLTEKNPSNDETPEHKPDAKGGNSATLTKICSVPVGLCQMAATLPPMNTKPKPRGRMLVRSSSAPGVSRLCVPVEYQQISPLPNMCPEPIPNEDNRRFSRPGMSADSVRNIIHTVSSKLNPGQWQELFRELMKETTNPTQNTKDICGILNLHQDDVRRATKSLELWRQVNGSFDIGVLLDALNGIRRKDIVRDVQKHISRVNLANANQTL